MTNSFFPRKDAELVVWANNYNTKIGLQATQLGLYNKMALEKVSHFLFI